MRPHWEIKRLHRFAPEGSIRREKGASLPFITTISFATCMVGFCHIPYHRCLVAQSCPTVCKPLNCSPPVSSVPGIFQERILEWVAISFSRRSSQPRDWTGILLCLLHFREILYALSHQGILPAINKCYFSKWTHFFLWNLKIKICLFSWPEYFRFWMSLGNIQAIITDF